MISIFVIILTLIIIPAFSALLILLFRKNTVLRNSISIIASISNLAIIIIFITYYKSSILNITTMHLFKITENLYFSLQVEELSLIFACLVCILWPFTVFYTLAYMTKKKEKNQTNFLFFLHMSLFATLGIAFSGNIFTTFIFYEALTLLTYPLVTHNGSMEAKKAGRFYLSILIGTSMVFFLPSIIITYVTANSVTYTQGGLPFDLPPYVVVGLFIMFIIGVSKLPIMPFHKWLPKAMVAPVPASALLHAVAVVKSGAFIILKLSLYIFGVSNLHNIISNNFSFNWLLLIPLFTIVISSFINLFETNLKKILAYSTIGQLSYILLCILLFNKLGVIAAIIYLVAHSFAKIVLFFAVGAIMIFTGADDLKDIKGIGRFLPAILVCFFISSLSIIGLPFTAGFVAKYYIIQALISEHNYFVWPFLIISSACISVYLLRVVYSAFFVPLQNTKSIKEMSFSADIKSFATITTTVIIILLMNVSIFLLYPYIVNFIMPITSNI